MSEENKAIVRRLVEEAIQRGNLDVIAELVAPDYVPHDPANPDRAGGIEGLRRFTEMLATGLSDVRYAIEDMIAEDDRVVYRWSLQGKHTGLFMGVAATGNAMAISGIDIFRLSGGKIIESWVSADALGMLRQLGVLSLPGASPTAPTSAGTLSAPPSGSPVSANPASAVPPLKRS